MSKEINRRGFLALGAGAVAATAVGAATSQADGNNTGIIPWSQKDFYGIVIDIMSVVADLQKYSKGAFEPTKDSFVIAIPTRCDSYLNNVNTYGVTVRKFCKGYWPNSELFLDEHLNNVYHRSCLQVKWDRGHSSLYGI